MPLLPKMLEDRGLEGAYVAAYLGLMIALDALGQSLWLLTECYSSKISHLRFADRIRSLIASVAVICLPFTASPGKLLFLALLFGYAWSPRMYVYRFLCRLC